MLAVEARACKSETPGCSQTGSLLELGRVQSPVLMLGRPMRGMEVISWAPEVGGDARCPEGVLAQV